MLLNSLKKFAKSESGAVTVDWVVLTAATAGISLLVMAVIVGGVNSAANSTNDELASSHTAASDLIAAN